jgi:shikimate dehydrogenase
MQNMYFIGVTTGQSAIHKLFPKWTALAGVGDARLIGIDIPIGAEPSVYREVVKRIRDDDDARGALVTTHKVSLFDYAGDLFNHLDDYAGTLGEISCIVRRGGELHGLATEPISASLAMREFLPLVPFTGSVLIFGAGGAGAAIALHLYRDHRPDRIVLTDIDEHRLDRVRSMVPCEAVLVTDSAGNDRELENMPEASLIVNATGMGKDRPGSPISNAAPFPKDAIAWELNYRGELLFLQQARAQSLHAVDGSTYFVHGWTQIMSRVFDFELTPDLIAKMRAETA